MVPPEIAKRAFLYFSKMGTPLRLPELNIQRSISECNVNYARPKACWEVDDPIQWHGEREEAV